MPWRSSSLDSRWRAAHQIAAHVLPRADEITDRFLLDASGPAPRCSASIINSRSTRSASRSVGLDLVLRRALDLPRRRHHAPDPCGVQSARASPYPVGPASYATRVGPGKPRQELHHVRSKAVP